MDYSSTQNGNTFSISFRGQFRFSDNSETQKVIEEITESGCSQCSINLGALESIDSAGLGMLLLINDAVQDGGKSLELCKPTGQVLKMLEISKFSEIITIKL